MAQYTVQDPQGNNRVIEGPDGASDEEIISQAQKLFGMSGSAPSQDPISAFKAALANHPARPMQGVSNPDQGRSVDPNYVNNFGGDLNYTQADTLPVEQRLLNMGGKVAEGFAAGQLGAGIANWGAGKVGSFLDFLKTPKMAEALAPTETAAEAGNTISMARTAEQTANKATADALYAKVPQDIKLPISTAKNTADTVANAIGKIDPAFQPSKSFLDKVEALQNMNKADIGSIQTMQSHLKDIATNGEGIEKVYAAQLSKALQTDLETFGNSSGIPALNPSQIVAPSMEGAGPASKFYEPALTGGHEAPFLTNSDIPANLSKANSYYRDMSGLNSNPLARALDKAALESKANVIFKSGRVDDVNTAKALLGDGYESAAGQFYDKIRTSKDVGQALSKYTPEFLNSALGSQRVKMLEALAHFNDLVAKAKTAAKVVGTGGVTVGTGFGIYKALH